jgi:uncharacterized protein YecE (DUF72 family)
MLPDNIKIGTSGFYYKDWVGNFYPQFCPQIDFLRFYSSQFKTVEIDATFYRLPTEAMVKKWVCCSPENFVFSAKFPRMVTHEGTVDSRIETARTFVNIMKHMGPKLGPLLLQFPYSFKPDSISLFQEIIRSLPDKCRIAVEIRNKSWLKVDVFLQELSDKNAALVLIDHPWMPKVNISTADFHYIRFLGDRKQIPDDFSYVRFDREADLKYWAKLISSPEKSSQMVYSYFNNHYSGHSPSTANLLIKLLKSTLGP